MSNLYKALLSFIAGVAVVGAIAVVNGTIDLEPLVRSDQRQVTDSGDPSSGDSSSDQVAAKTDAPQTEASGRSTADGGSKETAAARSGEEAGADGSGTSDTQDRSAAGGTTAGKPAAVGASGSQDGSGSRTAKTEDPEPQDSAAGEPEVIVPSFDLLRVDPRGSIVIAGRAAPESDVEVVTGSRVLAKSKSDGSGDFVVVFDEELKPGDYQIVLRSTTPGGVAAASPETAVVSIPETESGQVLALVEEAGKPSRLITKPEADRAEPPAADKAEPQTAMQADDAAVEDRKVEAVMPSAEQKADEPAEKVDKPAETVVAAAEPESKPEIVPEAENKTAQESETAPDSTSEAGETAARVEEEPVQQARKAEEKTTVEDGQAASEPVVASESEPVEEPQQPEQAKPDASPDADEETKIAAVPEPKDDGRVALPTVAQVAVEAVEIEGRKVFVAGMAKPDTRVRVYANEVLLGDAIASSVGRFLIETERDLPVGDYIIRADMLDANGANVVARAAVPFEREEGEKVAAVAPGLITQPEPSDTQTEQQTTAEEPTAPSGGDQTVSNDGEGSARSGESAPRAKSEEVNSNESAPAEPSTAPQVAASEPRDPPTATENKPVESKTTLVEGKPDDPVDRTAEAGSETRAESRAAGTSTESEQTAVAVRAENKSTDAASGTAVSETPEPADKQTAGTETQVGQATPTEDDSDRTTSAGSTESSGAAPAEDVAVAENTTVEDKPPVPAVEATEDAVESTRDAAGSSAAGSTAAKPMPSTEPVSKRKDTVRAGQPG